MFTGRQALSSIDEALQRATGQLVAAEQRITVFDKMAAFKPKQIVPGH